MLVTQQVINDNSDQEDDPGVVEHNPATEEAEDWCSRIPDWKERCCLTVFTHTFRIGKTGVWCAWGCTAPPGGAKMGSEQGTSC